MIRDRALTLRAYPLSGQGREWTVPLQFNVSIEQTNKRRPNKATIDIFNLSEGSIGFLEQCEVVEVTALDLGLLYRGDIRKVLTAIKEPDWKTTITCGDGGRAYRSATISRSWAPGTTSTTVLADVVAAMGLGLNVVGELEEFVFEAGHYESGRASDALEELAETLGAEQSIQDGMIEIVAPGAPTQGGVLLSPGTGLIGSPERKDRGIAAKALLIPALRPGRLFRLESRLITGWYRLTKTNHKAGSRGEPWETTLEARKP